MLIFLMLCTFLVATAGCSGPSLSTTHDSQLAQYIDATHQSQKENHPNNITVYRVTWNNSTTAHIEYAFTYDNDQTYSDTSTVIKFSSVDEASQYVAGHISGYKLVTTNYTYSNGPYERVMGHPPAVYSVYYQQSNAPLLSPSAVTIGGPYISQMGEFVWIGEQWF